MYKKRRKMYTSLGRVQGIDTSKKKPADLAKGGFKRRFEPLEEETRNDSGLRDRRYEVYISVIEVTNLRENA